ncbi:MAG: hypothetical protein JNL74_14120 [Fibrobacteres bacterium]|nr:hypothetical protein [Fibrobacterota bacterium]
MKTSHKIILVVSILTILFPTIVHRITDSGFIESYKAMQKLRFEGVKIKGIANKLTIPRSSFFYQQVDIKNWYEADIWYDSDSLHVIISGEDITPEKRKLASKGIDDKINDIAMDDRIKLSIALDRDTVNHTNYHYSFNGQAVSADNIDGQFVPGSKRPITHPFSWDIQGAKWTFKASIPLIAQKKIGFNISRRYYGKVETGWFPENLPNFFMTLYLN